MWSRMTVAEARDTVRDHLRPGVPSIRCPVCQRLVKLYKRKLDSIMGRTLLRFYERDRRRPGKFVDYRRVMEAGRMGEAAMLRHWEMLEAHPTVAGRWRITELGRDFCESLVRVPWAVWHWNRRAYGFTTRRTTIKRSVADTFDVDELMASLNEPSRMK